MAEAQQLQCCLSSLVVFFFSGDLRYYWGFPGGSAVKNRPANADVNSIPGREDCLGTGNGSPLEYSCLGNRLDSGARWAAVHGVARAGHDLASERQ